MTRGADELATLTIAEAGVELRAGRATAVDLVEACLSRIERFDPLLTSFMTTRPDSARAEAAAAQRELEHGVDRGPLHGIPVSVKDNIAVAGLPVTNGFRPLRDHVVDYNAGVVSRLRDAGAVILGTNTMHELAMGGSSANMFYGSVHNPWDTSRTAGGSSGGGGAATSAGLTFAAIGTDGWGSIRTPAAYNGVVGLKPSFGLVSRYGVLPPMSWWIADVGPLTKDVRDAALVLAAIAGVDDRDQQSRPAPADWTLDGIEPGSLTGVRVAVPTTYFFDDAVPDVVAVIDAAAATLQSLGAQVERVAFPSLDDVLLTLPSTHVERQAPLLRLALDHPEAFADREIRLRIIATDFLKASDVARSLQLRTKLRASYRAFMEHYDVLLTPNNSTPPFPISAKTVPLGPQEAPFDMSAPGAEGRVVARLTMPFNVLGMAAVSVPASLSRDGSPISIQLAVRPWHERELLRAALSFEARRNNRYRLTDLETAASPRPDALSGIAMH